jgi:hypothetical protein
MTIFLLLDKSNFKEKVIFIIVLKSYSNYYMQFLVFVDKLSYVSVFVFVVARCQIKRSILNVL